MNPTDKDSADGALAAAMAADYARRAKEVVSGGARTEVYEAGVRDYTAGQMLHGDLPPSQVINKEQPVHVLMCYMAAGGKLPQEIADATGYSVVSVRNIQRQPFFRKRFLQIASEAGKDTVKAFLDGEVMPSLVTLVEIRDTNKELRPHISAAAANSILDRALGRPQQKIETENHNFTHGKTVDEVDQELAAVREELKSRGHTGPN